jgi:branched-chain amino acid aminotransferase
VREVRLWIEKERKNRRDDIMSPQAKVSANYASPMVAKAKARAAGYDEIVLVDEEGHVAEGPTTNLFLVDAEGVLVTPPPAHVLLGVTRQSILELAVAEGIEAVERDVTPEALCGAREAFLTGTTAGVWPITSVDGEKLGEGEMGPVSKRLRERFKRAASGEDPEFAHWLTYVDERVEEPG